MWIAEWGILIEEIQGPNTGSLILECGIWIADCGLEKTVGRIFGFGMWNSECGLKTQSTNMGCRIFELDAATIGGITLKLFYGVGNGREDSGKVLTNRLGTAG